MRPWLMPDPLAFAWALAALLLLLSARARSRWQAGHDLALAALVAAAMASVLDLPPDNDTLPMRVAVARHDVWADWNHPPLSYALNLPTRWRLDVVSVRLVPLLWLIALTVGVARLSAAMARDLGLRAQAIATAAALGGLWFAVEGRRRTTVMDLGDWDLAGLFLIAVMLWVRSLNADNTQQAGPVQVVVGVALAAGGVGSSYLMAAPLTALTGWLTLRGRRWAAAGVALGLAAWSPKLVALIGAGAEVRRALTLVQADPLARVVEAVAQTPLGRTPMLGVPLVLGVVAMARRPKRWFEALAWAGLSVPAAVVVGDAFSHVNGGYYVDLVVPLLLPVLGVGGAVVAGRLTPGARAAAAAMVAWTFTLPPVPFSPEDNALSRAVPALAEALRSEDVPVVSTFLDVTPMLALELARTGHADLREVLPQPPDGGLRERVRTTTCRACEADPACRAEAARAWLVLDRRRPDDDPTCVERLSAGCRHLLPDHATPDGRALAEVWVVRCGARAAAEGRPGEHGDL